MGARTLLNLLRLLFLLFFFFFFFSKLNRILEGPKHARKVRKLCNTRQNWWNLRLIWVSEVGCGKMARQAPPINIQRSAPRATFHVHVRKSVHLCNLTIPTKKSPGTKSETQQEVGYFEFSRHILCHFCHFQVSYFKRTPPRDLFGWTPKLVIVI